MQKKYLEEHPRWLKIFLCKQQQTISQTEQQPVSSVNQAKINQPS
jgi:hypothetical protein